jgi:hypothetical protein
MTHMLRWWLLFTILLVATVLFVYTGFIWTVIASDVTYISVGIVVLLLIASAKLGMDLYNKVYNNIPIEFSDYQFVAKTMTKLGFVGTLIGMILLVDPVSVTALMSGDINATKLMMAKITTGIGTAVYTTLFGLVAEWTMTLQIKLARKTDE